MKKHYCDKCGAEINIENVSHGLPGHGNVYVINNQDGLCLEVIELCMTHSEEFEEKILRYFTKTKRQTSRGETQ